MSLPRLPGKLDSYEIRTKSVEIGRLITLEYKTSSTHVLEQRFSFTIRQMRFLETGNVYRFARATVSEKES